MSNTQDVSKSFAAVKKPSTSSQNIPKIMKQGALTPWLYLLPALLVMSFFIVYPMSNTISLSFQNKDGSASAATTCIDGQPCWGVFENYRYALTSEIDFSSAEAFWTTFWRSSYGNNTKWIVLMTAGTVGIGLALAALADQLKYESLVKALVFMPMAISFVGAGVIWRFVYNYETNEQIGLLNAIIQALGGEPIPWIATPGISTYMLIIVGIWMWTGFCMVVLSSALKSVPVEILEAAQVDGATGWITFWRITVPIIMPTILVVITTMVINVLKLFDIVYVMTGGNFGTNVIANRMYTEMYKNFNVGRGTAVAVILVLAIVPFIYYNVKRFTAQEAMR